MFISDPHNAIEKYVRQRYDAVKTRSKVFSLKLESLFFFEADSMLEKFIAFIGLPATTSVHGVFPSKLEHRWKHSRKDC